ncbi:MAG: tetratricopeptide repeat protein [Caulobacterales bacterium]
MTDQQAQCPPNLLSDAVAVVSRDELQGLRRIDALLRDYPQDARLHFLRGSLLASQQRYADAHEAMAESVKLAPAFWVARYQLGFLELTSGDAPAAEATWAQFSTLPDDYYLSLFVRGLHHLIRDDFPETIHCLREGIARNVDNPAMNRDMQLIIDALEPGGSTPAEGELISATHLLLRQYTSKTKH